MIRIFYYRLFWAIYDYLGTLTLSGLLVFLPFVGVLAGLASVASRFRGPQGAMAVVIVLSLLVLWLVASLSLLAGLALQIVRDMPARLLEAIMGIRLKFRRMASYVGVVLGGGVVIASNVAFYFKLAKEFDGPMEFAFLSLAVFFLVLGGCWPIFAMTSMGGCTLLGCGETMSHILRESVKFIVIAPRLWLAAFGTFVSVALLGALSVLGLLYILPLWILISSLAWRLEEEFVAQLRRASQELGPGHSVRAYARRAQESLLEAEWRRPPRTWKDIFKPWET